MQKYAKILLTKTNIFPIVLSKEFKMSFSVFEIGMLVCFGFAWPLNIYKSLTSKTAKGKSFLFLIVVLLGYVSGIIHKVLYSWDVVLVLYVINLIMVFTDILLYFRNKRYDLALAVQN